MNCWSRTIDGKKNVIIKKAFEIKNEGVEIFEYHAYEFKKTRKIIKEPQLNNQVKRRSYAVKNAEAAAKISIFQLCIT